MGLQRMQIGEVAARTGLSLRTIRYYEEMGLVSPSSRTPGGFRLYSDTDVARLHLGRLEMYRDAVNARVRGLRDQLATAEEFAADLRREIGRQRKLANQTQ